MQPLHHEADRQGICEVEHRTPRASEIEARSRARQRSLPARCQMALSRLQELHPDSSATECERFLVSCAWDVSRASTALKSTRLWRSENLPIPDSEVRDALENGIFSIRGTDSDGYPVIIIDGARLEEHGDNDNALRAMLHVGELALNAQPIRSEAKVSLLYLRARGVGGDIGLLRSSTKVFQRHYPGQLSKIVVTPMSSFFLASWKYVLRYAFNDRTRRKVHLIKDPEEVRHHFSGVPSCIAQSFVDIHGSA